MGIRVIRTIRVIPTAFSLSFPKPMGIRVIRKIHVRLGKVDAVLTL